MTHEVPNSPEPLPPFTLASPYGTQTPSSAVKGLADYGRSYGNESITESSKWQFAGYHGTSFDRAELIAEQGFKADGKNPVCFAPMDDLGFAQQHGRRRALEYGDTKYGVVMASFPPQELIFGMGAIK